MSREGDRGDGEAWGGAISSREGIGGFNWGKKKKRGGGAETKVRIVLEQRAGKLNREKYMGGGGGGAATLHNLHY